MTSLQARCHLYAKDLVTGVVGRIKDRDPAVFCERWRVHDNKLVVGTSLLVVAASNPMREFEQVVVRAAIQQHLAAA